MNGRKAAVLGLMMTLAPIHELANAADDVGQTVGKALQAYYTKGPSRDQIIENGATTIALTGMLYSLMWGNTFLQTAKREPFYCQPPELSLTGDQVMQILKDAVRDRPEVSRQPLGFALIVELGRIFPCPERRFR